MDKKIDFLKLSCAVQNYHWGKIGLDSEVARLKSGEPDFIINNEQPYAELWMGIHPKAPSIIVFPSDLRGQLLSRWLDDSNTWALGENVKKRFENKLPFLFKVLSINKALSIQAHPTKDQARKLHQTLPDKYPDDNHKPEMIVAITKFQGFCGFRPLREIKRFVSTIPELKNVLSSEALKSVLHLPMEVPPETQTQVLKICFTSLMNQDSHVIERELTEMMMRLEQDTGTPGLLTEEYILLQKLYSWFPGDVGCFCIFFLNIINLNPGQSMYLEPNVPHAYVSGDVVECMANSDNVVRAGLTPKFRDKDTLCDILSFISKPAEEQIFPSKPHPSSPGVTVYDPPSPEFSIARFEFKDPFQTPATNGPSIFLVLTGSGNIEGASSLKTSYCHGDVIFVPAMNIIKFVPDENTILFQGYCEF